MNWKKIAKNITAIALLVALFVLVDPQELAGSLSGADPVLYLTGVTLFLTTYIAAALRWQRLSRSIGYDLSIGDAFKIIAVSYSFNKLFPGNAGDVGRSKIFEQFHDVENHGNVLGIVALERYLGIVSLLGIIGVAFLFIDFPVEALGWILSLFAGILVAFSFLLLMDEGFIEKIKALVPIGSGFVSDLLKGYRSSSRRDVTVNLIYSLYIRLTEALVFYILILALTLETGFWEGAFVTSIMSLVSGLPISPGGLGPVDATGTGLLVVAGVTYSSALSLVILQRSVGLVLMAVIGALVYLLHEYLL